MFRLCLASTTSARCRPPPAFYPCQRQWQSQRRQYHLSPPNHSPTGRRIDPKSLDSRTSSKPSTNSPDSSSQEPCSSDLVPKKLADEATPHDCPKVEKDKSSKKLPDGAHGSSVANIPGPLRKREVIPEPPRQRRRRDEYQEFLRMERQRIDEKLRMFAEAKAQREALKEQKRQQWDEKRAVREQLVLDIKNRKLKVQEARDARVLQIKKNKEVREARQAEKKAEKAAKAAAALAAAEEIALRAQEKQEQKLKEENRLRDQREKIDWSSTTSPQAHREDAGGYLRWAFGALKRPGVKADRKRINLTSQSLADDILERLKPSLDKHKGCDIVDINPGAGIWSSTLHDYLKPRKHILLEPDEGLYRPLLGPLLDAPGSKYSLVPKSGIVWRHLEDILTKNYLPFQEAFEKGDPRLMEPNNTLLVVASLGFHPMRSYRGFASISQLVIHQLMASVRSHSLFQQYGQVRMLVWTGDIEASKFLPRVIAQRRKAAIEAEIACDMNEVASSTKLRMAGISDMNFAVSNAANVWEKMKKANLFPSPNRESDLLQGINRGTRKVQHDSLFPPSFLSALANLEDKFASGKFTKDLDESRRGGGGEENTTTGIHWTTEYALLRLYRRQYQSGQATPAGIQKLVEEHVTIMGLQRRHYLSTDGALRERLMEEIISRGEDLNNKIEDGSESIQEKYMAFIDNAQSSETDPPLLVWDSRDVEPLKVHPEEFYPEQEMTLLDLQPKPQWPIFLKNQPETWETFEFMLGQLLMVSRQPLKRGLEGLAPGAFEWLVAHCPLLTDPTKGGSLDPGNIRVRMLTIDMLKQMIKAWMEWPFRPTRYELIARSGSAAYDPDGLEEQSKSM